MEEGRGRIDKPNRLPPRPITRGVIKRGARARYVCARVRAFSLSRAAPRDRRYGAMRVVERGGGRKRRRSRIESANCSMEQLAERLLASLTTISVRALGAGGIPNCLCVCGWCCTLSACTGTTITGAMDFCGEGIFLRGKGDLTVTNFARASVFHFAKCN